MAPVAPALLTPGEVARMFHVAPRTVTRWGKAGKIPVIVTLGGHHRFHADVVQALLNGDTPLSPDLDDSLTPPR